MSTTSRPRILLLGGHGKIALHLTPLLLARQWSVTSVIRNPAHEAEIRALAPPNSAGQLDVLVESLEEVKKPEDARKVLEKTKADWVVWLAGTLLSFPSFSMRWPLKGSLIMHQAPAEKAGQSAHLPSTGTQPKLTLRPLQPRRA